MYRKIIKTLLFIFILNFLVSTAFTENKKEIEAVKQVYNDYTKAILNSDIEDLFNTITDGEEFLFLTSDGRAIENRSGYYEFHKEWFAEKNWEIEFGEPKVFTGGDYAYTVAKFIFKSKMSTGMIYTLDSWFTLIYRKENGEWRVVTDICTPVKRTTGLPGSEITYDWNQTSFFLTIQNRRTVRKFKPDPVPEEHILKILNAGRLAATAGNQQPWKFLVIRDRDKLEKLKNEIMGWYVNYLKTKMNLADDKIEENRKQFILTLDNILSAPVYVAILVDMKAKYGEAYLIQDGALAAGNIMLAARALGYGTGYYTTFFQEAIVKPVFGIPENYKLICFMPIGIPDAWPQMPPKKELKDLVVFETFEQK